jgi:hypothetical protein
MSSSRIPILVCVIGALILSAFAGCAAGPPATGSGAEASPKPGEEAGPCLSDGTCAQELECLDGVCVARQGQEEDAQEEEIDADEAEGDSESEGEEQGEGEAESEAEDETEGEADDTESEGEGEAATLLIFHNNSGPMCLAALDWLDGVKSEDPALVVEEHLTYETGERLLLIQLEAQFQTSQGVSTSFEYLPIVFFRDQAFSGFNDEVAEALQGLLSEEDGLRTADPRSAPEPSGN